jgi:hypothetical protein
MSTHAYVQVNMDAEAPGGSGCQAFVDWNENLGCCGEPAIGTAVCACLHEHVGERRVCAADAAEIQGCTGDEFVCVPCRDSAQPHECRMFITLRWDTS